MAAESGGFGWLALMPVATFWLRQPALGFEVGCGQCARSCESGPGDKQILLPCPPVLASTKRRVGCTSVQLSST